MDRHSGVPRVYYGWIVVAACFLGTFVIFGISYSFSVFFEQMLEEFGHSRGVTSIAFGIQTVTLYIGAVFVGVLVDRYGTRPLMLFGTVLLCLGLIWTSQATSLAGFVAAYGIVTGFGMCGIYVVSYATVPRWFDRRLGLAGGLASAGLGVGMLVGAPAATSLIEHVGWRQAFLIVTAAAGLLGLVATFLVRDDPTSAGKRTPADEFDGTPAGDGGDRPLSEQFADIREIASSKPFLLLFLGLVLIYATLYVVFVHFVVHVIDIGHTRAIGATAIALLGLGSTVGRIGIGIAGDSLGRIRVFIICSVAMGLSTAVLPLAETVPTLFAFGLIYGLAYGGNGALLGPLIADMFGRADINAVFGLVSAAFALVGLAAPYLAGVGQETQGTYDPVFVTTGVAAVLGALAIVGAGRYAA